MRTLFPLAALALCCLTGTAAAQDGAPASPVSDAFRATAERDAKNLTAAAEEMPAAKYGFKPTAAQMTFGGVIAHLIEGNDYLCSRISGEDPPKREELAKTAKKAELVSRLKETFDFCTSSLANVHDGDLDAKVKLFGDREFSKASAMFITAQDWADHYSQLAVYLRLNRLLPPTAKKKQSE
ncbi:MAG TPA: DinB family protein [Gemmatimonadales bacterium]|nr:DinB family protein [Gemmatimonadales bacterium]